MQPLAADAQEELVVSRGTHSQQQPSPRERVLVQHWCREMMLLPVSQETPESSVLVFAPETSRFRALPLPRCWRLVHR
jgi:hypothetical protein